MEQQTRECDPVRHINACKRQQQPWISNLGNNIIEVLDPALVMPRNPANSEYRGVLGEGCEAGLVVFHYLQPPETPASAEQLAGSKEQLQVCGSILVGG